MAEDANIRPVQDDDASRLVEIYNHYIENTVVTFETEPISPNEILKRIHANPSHLPWYVIEDKGMVVGYCYAAPWHPRSAYKNSVETTIYLDETACGKGLGKRTYSHLLAALDDAHAIIGGIALPNDASVALHESLGFQKVAHYWEVGHKFGRWIDVGYWQLLPNGKAN